MLTVTPVIMKAAKLFCAPAGHKFGLDRPRTYRDGAKNIVWASDGHTMFVANDVKGKGYRPYPKNRHGKNFLPDWPLVVAAIPADRKPSKESVWANPKYLARVTRASAILDVLSVPVKTGTSFDPLVFALGDHACAFVMPMRQTDVPSVPAWLAEHCAPAAPPKKAAKAKAKKRKR